MTSCFTYNICFYSVYHYERPTNQLLTITNYYLGGSPYLLEPEVPGIKINNNSTIYIK
jgi:hypothetical protein